MIGLETVLEQIARASSQNAVGEILATAARAEGFENLVLARCVGGDIVDLPWCWFPAGFTETYAVNNWVRSDPVLYEAFRSTTPIAWDDLFKTRRFTKSERDVMEIAATLGVRSGLTIPLHGPGSSCDLVSLSLRHGRERLDPARRNFMAMIALNATMRFKELAGSDDGEARRDLRDMLRHHRTDRKPVLDDFMTRGLNAPFVLSSDHLKALVLIELGARRWQMGLTQLAGQVHLRRATREIDDLERWGLAVEIADDIRWRYYLAPSALGHYFLRNPEADRFRHAVRASEVDRHEIADDIALED